MLKSQKLSYMLGKEAILHFFRKNYITTLFHLPGIHSLPLNVTMIQEGLNVIIGRHESNLIFMADGFARASGKAGVVIVTPGPGLGNIITGCMEAYNDDVPLLIINIDTERKDIGKGILHELKDPETIFTNITKKTFVVSDVRELIPAFYNAYTTALSPRRGPVVISIPYVLFEKEVPEKSDSFDFEEQSIDITGIESVLKNKKRPVIIGGKSLMFREAAPILDSLCTDCAIPFLTTTGGKGIVREDSTYAFGNVIQRGTVKDILESSDIVIAIGTRLREVDAKRRGVKTKELIHIDVDSRWINKNYNATFTATGSIEKALKGLVGILQGKGFAWDLKGLKDMQRKEYALYEKQFPGFKLIQAIRASIPEETIVVCDLNLPSYWAEYYFPVFHQQAFFMPRGASPIFYSIPAGIGAKVGRPESPCLSICGDGGALPAIAELATIVRYRIPVVMFIYNNNSFGILEDYMEKTYGLKKTMALNNPDFVKIAQSFGIKGKKVRTINQLKKVFLKDITWDEPFLIEFNYPAFPPPWRS